MQAETDALITAADSSVELALTARVEALLFVSGEAVTIAALAAALETSPAEIETALETLAAQCRSRGVRLQRLGDAVQIVTAPELSPLVQRFLNMSEVSRLSPAALETLAIIAYLQPITRPQLEMIRGVNCDGVIHTLLARSLIQELGRSEGPGHPMRYGVSLEFLQYFGLSGAHELPSVEHLEVLPQPHAASDAGADSHPDPKAAPPSA